jgi:pimeloyl-ACP methyl ester carboxylesterase
VTPTLCVHLVGHSFGARVVSYALKGMSAAATGPASPVKSLTLIQGAFSHFAFAPKLPHDQSRSGALAGMAVRVDGPILVTHSQHDLAVCDRYPQASIISREDAAAFDELRYRFGGMGADGAQAVDAEAVSFRPAGQGYPMAKGQFLNLNGDDLITRGNPPSGAHSDIFYEEIAWAVMLAAGVVNTGAAV